MTEQEIRDGAPEGATHYGDEGYWLVELRDDVYMWVFENNRSFWKLATPAQCLFAVDIKPPIVGFSL